MPSIVPPTDMHYTLCKSKRRNQCQPMALSCMRTKGGPRKPKRCNQCQPGHCHAREPRVARAKRRGAINANQWYYGACKLRAAHAIRKDVINCNRRPYADPSHRDKPPTPWRAPQRTCFARAKGTVCLDPARRGAVSAIMKQDLDRKELVVGVALPAPATRRRPQSPYPPKATSRGPRGYLWSPTKGPQGGHAKHQKGRFGDRMKAARPPSKHRRPKRQEPLETASGAPNRAQGPAPRVHSVHS